MACCYVSVRLHYHTYLTAASHDDAAAHQAMAAELTLIHGVPVECSEREFLRELQNALIWINFRFYFAPMFWLVVGVAYALLGHGEKALPAWFASLTDRHRS